MSLQINLLCIVEQLAEGGSVPVAVGGAVAVAVGFISVGATIQKMK